MNDQELYKVIGQLLFNESPANSKKLNISIYLEETAANFSVWRGEKMSRDSSMSLSTDGMKQILGLFRQLQQFYESENMGKWNVAFYTLDIETGSFDIDFDNCKELDTGELTLGSYRKRYQ